MTRLRRCLLLGPASSVIGAALVLSSAVMAQDQKPADAAKPPAVEAPTGADAVPAGDAEPSTAETPSGADTAPADEAKPSAGVAPPEGDAVPVGNDSLGQFIEKIVPPPRPSEEGPEGATSPAEQTTASPLTASPPVKPAGPGQPPEPFAWSDLELFPYLEGAIAPNPKTVGKGFNEPNAVAEATMSKSQQDALPDRNKIDYAYGAFQRGRYLTALSIATGNAVDGDPAACTLIGVIYANGLGVPQNTKEAAIWYQLGADRGDSSAMLELANLYANGDGVTRDAKKAGDLLEQAHKLGRVQASYGLGLLYLSGKGRPKDVRRATDLFLEAAEAGNGDAEYALASLYLDGEDKNPVRAAEWMGKAALNGIVAAEVEYAIMLYNGSGVVKNERLSAAWFELAARQGNPIAQNRLARLYAIGSGVERDDSKAVTWYLRSRAAGIQDTWLEAFMEKVQQQAAKDAAPVGSGSVQGGP
ncbi:SEL1-like repeat protein [Hartmannibacter diazotrophicus]|nr:SEL1-like repeat protein [Hartmannibacter diazotrophicus]